MTNGMTLSISEPVAEVLMYTAQNFTTKSRRGQLAVQLAQAPAQPAGFGGTSHRIKVPHELTGDMRHWVMDAKKCATTDNEKEGIRRLSRAIFKYSGLD